jgi:ATP-dependent Clp endopeptidase proteolytic subunit ClpP
MNLKYRSQRNAEATARYWNKPIDKADWYKIEALSEDNTEVMIYDVIGWPFNDAGEIIRAMAGINTKSLTVRINSPGGDVFDGIAIFNALQSHKSKVITRIESLAASISSVIALAGKEVQAYQNAMLMIHDPWVLAAGNQYDLREIADILEKISGNMVDIYSQNSSVGKKEIRDMLKTETWFTAKEAKERGFIDTIIDGKAAKAQFDLSMFAHVPDGFQSETNKPTEREIEKALRDVGLSKKEAKALLAGRLQDTDGADEEVLAAQNLLNKIGGK